MGAGFIQIRACHLKRKADTHRLETRSKRLALIFAKNTAIDGAGFYWFA
jgi:hypothetical protein